MAKVSIASVFPPGYFLENIARLPNDTLFVTCANRQELYYIPSSINGPVSPILVHTFPRDQWAMGIIEAPQSPNVFFMLTSDILSQGSKTSYLHVLDIANAGMGSRPHAILTFPPEAKGLNGLCALSESTLLAADSFASCIWRIDLDLSTFPPKNASAKVWCSHPTMAAELVLPDFQPGTNGLKYSQLTRYVYYTSTQQMLFCRVRVNATSFDAEDEPEVLATGMPGDDFIIYHDWPRGPVAYLTTHRDSSILKIPLSRKAGAPALQLKDIEVVVQGGHEVENMLGPTAGVWLRLKEGKSAFFTTDGGLKNPLSDGIVRCAKVVRVDF